MSISEYHDCTIGNLANRLVDIGMIEVNAPKLLGIIGKNDITRSITLSTYSPAPDQACALIQFIAKGECYSDIARYLYFVDFRHIYVHEERIEDSDVVYRISLIIPLGQSVLDCSIPHDYLVIDGLDDQHPDDPPVVRRKYQLLLSGDDRKVVANDFGHTVEVADCDDALPRSVCSPTSVYGKLLANLFMPHLHRAYHVKHNPKTERYSIEEFVHSEYSN